MEGKNEKLYVAPFFIFAFVFKKKIKPARVPSQRLIGWAVSQPIKELAAFPQGQRGVVSSSTLLPRALSRAVGGYDCLGIPRRPIDGMYHRGLGAPRIWRQRWRWW